MLYVATPVHEKSVVLRIIDEAGEQRSLFTPEKYADKIRINYENSEDIICHQLCLQFMGFQDETKKFNPILKIDYKSEAMPAQPK